MRTLLRLAALLTLAIGAMVLAVAMVAVLRPPAVVEKLAARNGPPLAAAKTWGYQLQNFDAKLLPAEIDLMVVDYSRDGTETGAFSRADVEALRQRPDGRRRIVLAYMSIGEAERYRYYWRQHWQVSPPRWLGRENPAWKGNYAVQYWDRDWQRVFVADPTLQQTPLDRILALLFPPSTPYIDQILEAGFDGVYLDRVDAYENAIDTRPAAKSEMIGFVEAISSYAKRRREGFLVVPQNAEILLNEPRYIAAIDGIGKEDLVYGEAGDGVPNNASEVRHMVGILGQAKSAGRPVFVVEYLSDPAHQQIVLSELREAGFTATFTDRGLSAPPALPPAFAPLPTPKTSPLAKP